MKKMFISSVLLSLAALVLLMSCAGPKPSIQSLATTNPSEVVALQDSLLTVSKDDAKIVDALVLAHTNIGNEFYQSSSYSKAIESYNRALALSPRSKPALYGVAMSNGQINYKKGSPNALWESIEHFGKAAVYAPENGEPHYWMAKAYEKKDDDDFELIIEAYDLALSKSLPESLKGDAESSRVKILKAKQVFETFWK